jgi:hypothetical protein
MLTLIFGSPFSNTDFRFAVFKHRDRRVCGSKIDSDGHARDPDLPPLKAMKLSSFFFRGLYTRPSCVRSIIPITNIARSVD